MVPDAFQGFGSTFLPFRCRRSYAVRWRRCRVSKSWHSWQVLASLPSVISILSLPHSQVRFRISSARSSSRFRLLSGLQFSSTRSRYSLVNLV